MITFEKFKELFEDLDRSEKISIYNEYCLEHGCGEDMLQYFDEEFFDTYFEDKMEVCRATFFGDIKSWSDEYIRFNAYGNLESVSDLEAEDIVEDSLEEIFEHPDVWEDYIEDDEDEDENEGDE